MVGYHGTVDDRTALEEVRVSERELLGIKGELDGNWKDLVVWIRQFGSRGNDGNVRTVESGEAIDRLHIAIARIEGVTRNGRVSVPFTPPEPAPLPTMWKTRATRHALELHAAMHELHHRRQWLRSVFEAWSPGTPDIEPLATLEAVDESEKRRRQLSALAPRYQRRVAFAGLGYLLVASMLATMIVYSWLAR